MSPTSSVPEPAIHVILQKDPATLLARVAQWPLELEVLCNMPVSMAARMSDQGENPAYLAVIRQSGRDIGAAVMTPDELMIAAEPGSASDLDAAAELLAASLESQLESLPGAFGSARLVGPLAAAWSRRRGVETQVGMSNNFYRLDKLSSLSRSPAGEVRYARLEDLELVAKWLDIFVRDAELPPIDAPRLGSYLIGNGDVMLWIDDGSPVSLAAISGRTPRSARIGFVYTPPARRSRGYGGAVTAAITRHARDGGAVCCLYADAYNDLTNRLYQRLGYRRIEESLEILFP